MTNLSTYEMPDSRPPHTLMQASNQRSLSLGEMQTIATAFHQSGMFKDATSAAKALAKIIAGQELGLGPMAAMSQLHVIEGKVTMDATLVGAQIKKSGRYDYRIVKSTDKECVLEFFEQGDSLGESAFTLDEARQANLIGKDVWKKYPKAMLRSRAMTQGARMYCPDVFNGAVYTPEELTFDDKPPKQTAPSINSLAKKAIELGICESAQEFGAWARATVPECADIPPGQKPTLEQCLAIAKELERDV